MKEVFALYNDLIFKLPPFVAPVVRAFLVFIVSLIVVKISSNFIDKIFLKHKKGAHINKNKRKTLSSLFKSIVRYVTYFVAGVNILEIFGIKTASLITAAGVGGLAVGFGAQNLVKDVISGFFIIFEDQYNVGDYIEVAGVSGTVEEVGIRSTKLRDFGGQLHIIPNGAISMVTNHSKGVMRAKVEVQIAYEEDLDKALICLEKICINMSNKCKDIVEGPSVLGVSDLQDSGLCITIIARTVPMQQWSVERALRKAVLDEFKKEGIEIPYPRTVILKKNKFEEGG